MKNVRHLNENRFVDQLLSPNHNYELKKETIYYNQWLKKTKDEHKKQSETKETKNGSKSTNPNRKTQPFKLLFPEISGSAKKRKPLIKQTSRVIGKVQ